MAKYSDEYRTSAIVMLEAQGYPDDSYALGRVHSYLKSRKPFPTKATLLNWYQGEKTPSDSKVLNDKKRDMTLELKGLVWKLIDHAGDNDTISDMSGQQTITSIGILIDKIRLLTGLPTQIVQIMPSLMTSFENAGIDATDFFQKAKARADAIAKERD